MTEKPTTQPDVQVVVTDQTVGASGRGEDWRALAPNEDDFAANLEFLMGNLRSVRKRRGLTQKTVAQRMKVSQSRVSALETGSLEKTEIGALASYFRALGVRLSLKPEINGET
jgi:predicted XRE-type DNA-binding protein